MAQRTIELFMWPYQTHFRVALQIHMESAMKALSLPNTEVDCMLVGFRIPGRDDPNEVCIEPEDGVWDVTLFRGLAESVEEEFRAHYLRDVRYTDQQSTAEKPTRMLSDSVRSSVQKLVAPKDTEEGLVSFCGRAREVGNHCIVPILRFPAEAFDRISPLREVPSDWAFTPPPSLLHAVIRQVLDDGFHELAKEDPGKSLSSGLRSSQDVLRRAGSLFLYAPGKAIGDENYFRTDLFERLNLISSWMYEGQEGKGRILITRPENGTVDMAVRFAVPVALGEPRWARKVLQMASNDTALVADTEKIYGLGSLAGTVEPWKTQNVFHVEFLDHYQWRLCCGERVLLVSKFGVPQVPREPFPVERLRDIFVRLFPAARKGAFLDFARVYDAALGQNYGSMLVVAADAEAEALRLQRQGARIEPTSITPELYRQLSRVDGSILVDPNGVCQAVGVILDGSAREECTPSRGSRYNSAVRYVLGARTPRLAIVVSDDGTVDVIPELKPRMSRSKVEQMVSDLETATKDNYQTVIDWLARRRFYLSGEQCDRVNEALARIESEPQEVGEIILTYRRFAPSAELDDGYFEE